MDHLTHRPNHHTTHMIDSIKRVTIPSVHRESKEDAHTIVAILHRFQTAKKFVLPFNGLLFEDTHFARYSPLLKLPFQSVVLEYNGDAGAYFKDGALTRHPDPELSDFGICLYAQQETDKESGREGIRCFVAYGMEKNWQIMPVSVWFPGGVPSEDWNRGKIQGVTFAPETLFEDWRAGRGTKEGEVSAEDAAKRAVSVIAKEAMSLFHFCAALNCQNVRAEVMPAPKFINRKREAKGEAPLFEYHVLTVDTTRRNEHGDPQGGTHASPREHIRRGHIRRYKTGLTIWINSMVVGRSELGRIDKDYRLKGEVRV